MGPPVTVKGEPGEGATEAKLPVKTPLPVFLMVRFFVTGVAPAGSERVRVLGADSFPGKPAPFKVTVNAPLPKASLLRMVTFAVLVSMVGAKVTSSF